MGLAGRSSATGPLASPGPAAAELLPSPTGCADSARLETQARTFTGGDGRRPGPGPSHGNVNAHGEAAEDVHWVRVGDGIRTRDIQIHNLVP